MGLGKTFQREQTKKSLYHRCVRTQSPSPGLKTLTFACLETKVLSERGKSGKILCTSE